MTSWESMACIPWKPAAAAADKGSTVVADVATDVDTADVGAAEEAAAAGELVEDAELVSAAAAAGLAAAAAAAAAATLFCEDAHAN